MDIMCESRSTKVGLARLTHSRSNSVDNALSNSISCGSPPSGAKNADSHSKFRKLNPFSRSTPRLHNLSDSSQDKMSVESYEAYRDFLNPSISVSDVSGSDIFLTGNEIIKTPENGPKRKGAIKERASGRRKSSLAAAVLDKARVDEKARLDATKARAPRLSVPALSPITSTPVKNTNVNNHGVNTILCGLGKQSEDKIAQNSPLCGTPDIGVHSTASPYKSYTEAFSSVPFQNFFSKRVKSNLKRTKSVTKLDRRKMGTPSSSDSGTTAPCSEPDGSPRFSLKRTMSLGRLGKKLKYKHSHPVPQHRSPRFSLKRTMSLGRLGKKLKYKHSHPVPQHSGVPAAGVIQSSRSHESLLSSPTQLSNIDLSAPDVEIKPLHSSMLGQDHCFQVSTSNGSKYYSCRSAEERQAWIQHLRKTVEPHQEQSRRTDNSVRVWIQEAKNIPAKKRYFCEICLDGTIYARTSTKSEVKSDTLFWGEQFEFTNLPRIDVLTINIYKEPEKKKKRERNLLIGYLRVPMSDISGRVMVEKWYPVSSATVGKAASRTELTQLRVRGRYHSVDILPTDMYHSFIQYLERDHCTLVDILEPVISVKLKEEIATCLVKILQKRDLACTFLSDIVMDEVNRIENNSLAFRGNTIATKAMEAYMKLVGDKYLKDTLGEFIRHVLETDCDCEVDPSRLQNNSELAAHQESLTLFCQMAWFKIINSHAHFPREMRRVLHELRERCVKHERDSMSDTLISSFVFLRFLCPAILSPSLFKLCQELPGTTSARSLTLTAKTIQNLANFTHFGEKEDYMIFLNEFVERETQSMRNFLQQISSGSSSTESVQFDGFIDLGKELAVLCTLLQDALPTVSQDAQEKVSDLQQILNNIDTALKEPQNTQSTKCNNLTVYNQLYNTTSHNTMEITRHDVTSETITNQINEWSAFANSSSKYPGSAFDNPHRNGGTLPRRNKLTGLQANESGDACAIFSQHDLLASPKSIDLSATENSKVDLSTDISESSTVNRKDDVSNSSAFISSVSETTTSVSMSETSALNREMVSGLVITQSTPISPVNAQTTNTFSHSLNSSALTYTSTLPDTRLGPSQSTPARRLSEREINGAWDKMLSAAELVNGQGELIDLIKFADQEDEQMESSEQISTLASSSGYQSFTSSASPPQNHAHITSTPHNHTDITTQQNHTAALPNQAVKHQAISFTNPLFGQLPSAYVKPKKTVVSETSQTPSDSHQHFNKTTSDNVDINMQMSMQMKPNTDSSLHGKKQHVSRQAQPPQDLFSWQRHHVMNKSADQGWANLNTPQSRAPLSSALPSQILFSADHVVSSPDHVTPQAQPMAAYSPSHMSANDDYVTLAPPVKSQSGTSTPGDDVSHRYIAEGAQKKTAQSAVRMGVSSVHRKVVEHEKHKVECEEELTLLREQLAETQRMLSNTQQRLLVEEQQRKQVIEEYERQMKKSQEELNRKQEEKDRELQQLKYKLESQEQSLRTEQMELQCVVSDKQRIIQQQEHKIHSLDAANNRLLSALGQLRDRYNTNQHNGVKSRDKITLGDSEGLRSSFC